VADGLASILPAAAVAVERGSILDDTAASSEPGGLHPIEEALIAGAGEARRREFAEARACAREALTKLGAHAEAIGATPDGAPVWPEHVVGSITHKGGYRAAAVAWADDLAGIGIDAEPDVRLPHGVLETIASPGELDRVEALLERHPGLAWDRLLFCAKEAAVKAAHPLGLGVAGVRAVEVALDAQGFYSAQAAATAAFPEMTGSWVAAGGMLLTVVSVPR